ncbi:MAG TPA: CDP-diacylglycerol diphosphatase [Steroidobacteraceae bacterium]|nr:CDP-diacylglycerol diphosphatase [Steroidobacteraceae bacterium]
MRALKLTGVAIAALTGAALVASPGIGANRDALRQIVQEQCLVHWVERHDPEPCERVEPEDPLHHDSGFAVLADRKGGAHFLLIPTRSISGIESPELVLPDAPNYFAAAWQARDRLAAVIGHDIARNAIGLAVNSKHARSQDQLHIHIECLRREVFDALSEAGPRLGAAWAPLSIGPASYSARRLSGEDLNGQNPFKLLRDEVPEARRDMSAYTLVVAGADEKSGSGFIVMAGTTVAGELLLDSTCAVASNGARLQTHGTR